MTSLLRCCEGNAYARLAVPVPTDEVVPVYDNDDTKIYRKLMMLYTWRFDDVLDPHKLQAALEELLQMDGWRKLGGRLRLNSCGKLEVHIPRPFTSTRRPVTFSSAHVSSPMSEDPLASQLPQSSGSAPSLHPSPGRYKPLALGPDAPRTIKDLLRSDRPQISVHVVTFADGTLVSILYPHTTSDLSGRVEIMRAWSQVLAGKSADVKPMLSCYDDPLVSIYEQQDGVPAYRLSSQLLTGWRLLKWGASFVIEGKLKGWKKSFEARTLCIPADVMSRLRNAARQGLDKEEKDAFFSDGDLLVALAYKMTLPSLSTGSTRTITMVNAVDPRSRISKFRKDAAYVQNCALAYFTSFSADRVAAMSLGELALESRRAVNDQVTEEQLIALGQLSRSLKSKSGSGLLVGDGRMFCTAMSNWSKSGFYGNTIDFAPAVVSKSSSRPQTRKPGRPVYWHGSSLGAFDLTTIMFNIYGRDHEGNTWLGALLPRKTWTELLLYLDTL